MRPRGIAVSLGGVVAVGLVGAVVGYTVGRPAAGPSAGAATVTFADASPMPARPAVPIDPPPTYAPDPGYPALAPGLSYTAHTLRSGPYVWHYDVPVGWVGQHSLGPNQTPQVTWRPPVETQPDSPSGGYQLRVAPVGGHSTPGQMITSKWTGLEESQAAGTFTELNEVKTSAYAAWYTYRDATGHFRLDDFAWVDNPGPDGYVGFELSVAGRRADQAGLDALLAHVYASAYRTTVPRKAPRSSAGPSRSATSGPSSSSSPGSTGSPTSPAAPPTASGPTP